MTSEHLVSSRLPLPILSPIDLVPSPPVPDHDTWKLRITIALGPFGAMVAGDSAGVGVHTVQHCTVQPSRPRCDAELDSQDAAGSRAFHLRKQHVTFALSLGFGVVPESADRPYGTGYLNLYCGSLFRSTGGFLPFHCCRTWRGSPLGSAELQR